MKPFMLELKGRVVSRGLLALAAAAALGLAACQTEPVRIPSQGPTGLVSFDVSPVRAQPRDNGLDEHWHHGAFMEIFVRAYQDSDGDGIGDLRGLINRLDHLRDLGVRGIWLMPVTLSSDRDHGYATRDFRQIEPDYGTMADMRELLQQAHRRGIGVIMDYVINHGSHEFPPFQAALADPKSDYRHWFLWSHEAPQGWDIWGKNPWYHAASRPWTFQGEWKDLPAPPAGATGHYFGTFGAHMPDFNLRHPAALRYHFDSLRLWMNMGLDGVRLDAVPHMIENNARDWNDQPESRALTRQLQDLVKSYPKRYTVCEATASPEVYGHAAVCGAAFAFGLVPHIVAAPKGDGAAVKAMADYWKTAPPGMATFLSNHDIFAGPRAWDQYGGDETRYKLAAATYLLMPGTPFIYYGEEVGQAGLKGLSGDLPIRGPMSWSSAANAGFTTGQAFRAAAPNAHTHNVHTQASRSTSILRHYQAMLRLRNTQPSLARGAWERSFAQGLVLGFERTLGGDRTLVLINYGTQAQTVSLSASSPTDGAALLWASQAHMAGPLTHPAAAALQGTGHRLEAQSVQVWKLGATSPPRGSPSAQ